MGALSAVVGIWVVLDIVLVFFLQWEHKPKPTFSLYSLYKATEAYLSIAEAEKKCCFKLMPLFCSHCLLRFLSTVLPQPLQGAHHCTCVHKLLSWPCRASLEDVPGHVHAAQTLITPVTVLLGLTHFSLSFLEDKELHSRSSLFISPVFAGKIITQALQTFFLNQTQKLESLCDFILNVLPEILHYCTNMEWNQENHKL